MALIVFRCTVETKNVTKYWLRARSNLIVAM